MELGDLIFERNGTYLITLLLALLLWKIIDSSYYWKKRGVTYVKTFPLFGSILENLKPFHVIEYDRYKKYGSLYGHFVRQTPALSVADPNLLRKILVKDFHIFPDRNEVDSSNPIISRMVHLVKGDEWKRIRSIMSPTFTTAKLKKKVDAFKNGTKILIKNFSDAAETGCPVNVWKLYGAFTIDVIASTFFSVKLDSHNDPNNKFAQAAHNIFQKNNWRFFITQLIVPVFKVYESPQIRQESLDFFANTVYGILEERKRTGQKGNDLLQLLLDSSEGNLDQSDETEKKDDIASNYGKEASDDAIKDDYTGKKSLTPSELVAQCVALFVAGFDTTASTLSFTSYYLALNEDVQEKLIQEVDEAVKQCRGNMTYEVVQGMKYLDRVISETLRMSPPASRAVRNTNVDYVLEGKGFTIPKDTVITVPICAIHMDPKYWPNPTKYDPDRFTPENNAKRTPYTYLPFGLGPRFCIGMRFALIEMKICLTFLLSNFRFKRCPETKENLEYYIGQFLLQPKDITLKLEKRKDAPSFNL